MIPKFCTLGWFLTTNSGSFVWIALIGNSSGEVSHSNRTFVHLRGPHSRTSMSLASLFATRGQQSPTERGVEGYTIQYYVHARFKKSVGHVRCRLMRPANADPNSMNPPQMRRPVISVIFSNVFWSSRLNIFKDRIFGFALTGSSLCHGVDDDGFLSEEHYVLLEFGNVLLRVDSSIGKVFRIEIFPRFSYIFLHRTWRNERR